MEAKVGDIMVCIKNQGEIAADIGRMYEIARIDISVYRIKGFRIEGEVTNEYGLYAKSVRMATPEETEQYKMGVRRICEIINNYQIY